MVCRAQACPTKASLARATGRTTSHEQSSFLPTCTISATCSLHEGGFLQQQMSGIFLVTDDACASDIHREHKIVEDQARLGGDAKSWIGRGSRCRSCRMASLRMMPCRMQADARIRDMSSRVHQMWNL